MPWTYHLLDDFWPVYGHVGMVYGIGSHMNYLHFRQFLGERWSRQTNMSGPFFGFLQNRGPQDSKIVQNLVLSGKRKKWNRGTKMMGHNWGTCLDPQHGSALSGCRTFQSYPLFGGWPSKPLRFGDCANWGSNEHCKFGISGWGNHPFWAS